MRAKKSTSLSKKQVEKWNEVKNASTEKEILYGLQTKDHSLQPSTLGIICKSKDYVKSVFWIKCAFSANWKTPPVSWPTVRTVANAECCFGVSAAQNITQEECQNPMPEIICNKNADKNQLLNAGCLKYILHKRCNDVNTPASAPVEGHFCLSLRWLPIDHMRESASMEAAIDRDSKGKKT